MSVGIILFAVVMSLLSASLCFALGGGILAVLLTYVGTGMTTSVLLVVALCLRDAISDDDKSSQLGFDTAKSGAST